MSDHPSSNKNEPQGSEQPWPFDAPVPPGGSATEPPLKEADEVEHSRIATEAYRIAESKGFPENAEIEHWLEAERNVKADRS
jgi:hypothetical protein